MRLPFGMSHVANRPSPAPGMDEVRISHISRSPEIFRWDEVGDGFSISSAGEGDWYLGDGLVVARVSEGEAADANDDWV